MRDQESPAPKSNSELMDADAAAEVKRPFEKPRLKYVPPKLVKQATVEDVTAGFIGTFYP